MEIKLFLNKDINTNANFYFEKAKKLKGKIPGVEKSIERTKQEIAEFENKKESYLKRRKKEEKLSLHKKKEWFEKFRWTKTQSGYLCVFGKDAGTNEILIKKHLEKDDIVFHTEEPKSPFGILKGGLNKASDKDIFECAQVMACFSDQWKRGYGSADVFWVEPKQITKKAISGEYMTKGSFMIYGKKNILKNIPLRICLGVIKEEIEIRNEETENLEKIEYITIFSGTEISCKKYCSNYIKIEPGKDTYKALNKEIKKRLKVQIEDLPKHIPNNCKILKK